MPYISWIYYLSEEKPYDSLRQAMVTKIAWFSIFSARFLSPLETQGWAEPIDSGLGGWNESPLDCAAAASQPQNTAGVTGSIQTVFRDLSGIRPTDFLRPKTNLLCPVIRIRRCKRSD